MSGRELHPELMAQARNACAELLGVTPSDVQAPRRTRVGLPESFRCLFGTRSVIATCRATPRALALEARTLRELGARGVPVPKLLAQGEDWIIVEDVGSRRLSREINQRPELSLEELLRASLTALCSAHAAGREARLDAVSDPLRTGRADELVQMIDVLASLANVPAPAFDVERARLALNLAETCFIKHSAHPAHIVLVEGDAPVAPTAPLGQTLVAEIAPVPELRVVLIDWQEAGPGDPLEDMVTLLGDESLPDDALTERELIDDYLPQFGGESRRELLFLLGTLHIARRLVMILSFKGDDDWWEREEALARDLPVVRAEAVSRLAQRAARWSIQAAPTQSLSAWFHEVGRVATTSRAD